MGTLRPTPPQAGILTFGQSLNLSDSVSHLKMQTVIKGVQKENLLKKFSNLYKILPCSRSEVSFYVSLKHTGSPIWIHLMKDLFWKLLNNFTSVMLLTGKEEKPSKRNQPQ